MICKVSNVGKVVKFREEDKGTKIYAQKEVEGKNVLEGTSKSWKGLA